MAKNNLDEESEDNQAPDEAADTAFSSPDKETGDEEDALKAANDQRTAEEIAQAQALEKPDDATPAPTAPAADLIDADDDKTEAAKPSDDDKKDVAADDEAAEDAIVEDDDKENAPKVDPNMIAAYNAVKDDKNMSPLQKKQMMMETYQQLLAQQRKGLAQAALLQGGSKIAQGMAMKYGANPGDNAEGVKTMQDMANLPVQQYLQNQLNQYRVQRAGLADAQANLATQKAAQVQSANSALNPALVKLMQLNWTKANPKADPSDMPDFASMTPNDLKQMGLAKPNPGQTQIINKPDANGVNHNILVNKTTGEERDLGVKGQAIRFKTDPFDGNLKGYGAQGVVTLQGTPDNISALKQAGLLDETKAPAAAGAPGDTDEDNSERSPDSTTPKAPPEITLDQLRQTDNRKADYVQKQSDALLHDRSVIALRTLGSKENNLAAKLEGFKKDANGNTVVDSGMAAAIAAQAGALSMGGVPPESVMSHFGGAGGWANSLNRTLTNASSGAMTPADVNFFKKYSDVMRRSLEKSVNDNAQSYITHVVNQFSPGIMTRNNAAKLLAVDDLMPNSTGTSDLVTIKGPSGQVVKMKKDNAKKYLKMTGYSEVPPATK